MNKFGDLVGVIVVLIIVFGVVFFIPALFIYLSGGILGIELTFLNGLVLWITLLIIVAFVGSVIKGVLK